MTHQPAGTYLPPDPTDHTANMARRVHLQEQRPQPGPVEPVGQVVASTSAPITSAQSQTAGPVWPWRSGLRLLYVIITAVNVDTSTSVTIYRGDDPLVSVSVDSDGVTRLGRDDVYTVADRIQITAAGDVGRLVVQLEFAGHIGTGIVFSTDGGDEQ